MPGDLTTSPPPGPVVEDPVDDVEGREPKTGEDRPTLVPEIDLEALAKLGPEAFANRTSVPADLLALAGSLDAEERTAPAPSVAPKPKASHFPKAKSANGARASGPPPGRPTLEVALELDMFELDAVDVAFESESHLRSAAPAVMPKANDAEFDFGDLDEKERPTSRPPSAPAKPAPQATSAAAATPMSIEDDFFSDLDDPSDLGALTEPPGESPATEIPPMPSGFPLPQTAAAGDVDDIFGAMIDEPFPPSMENPGIAVGTVMGAAAVPAAEPSNDEIFDADADEAMAKLRERFEAKDFPGALHLAETLINDVLHADEVAEIAARCRSAMQARYVERIGSLTKVPVISVPMSVILDLPIDNRAGFLLSRIDGVSSLEMILDMCGMSELDALRIVYDLVQNGALEFI